MESENFGQKQSPSNTNGKKPFKLTLDQKKELLQMFNFFMETEGTTKVLKNFEFRTMMRALGFHYSVEDLDILLQKISKSNGTATEQTDYFTLDRVISVCTFLYGGRDSREELSRSFNLFSSNGERVTIKDLRRIARECGESMTEDDFLILVDISDTDGDGEIDVDEWISILSRIGDAF
ncbi:Centrin-3 [Lobulomyces angularis]|nr:Centrin-3 [Lobulomyces angularis]